MPRAGWWTDAATKRTLRSFMCFKDREDTTTIVKAKHSRMQQSLLEKHRVAHYQLNLRWGNNNNNNNNWYYIAPFPVLKGASRKGCKEGDT